MDALFAEKEKMEKKDWKVQFKVIWFYVHKHYEKQQKWLIEFGKIEVS